jgi:hypothetical protein
MPHHRTRALLKIAAVCRLPAVQVSSDSNAVTRNVQAQYDFGDGPVVNGAATVLFCLWLAWCRFRVVIPILDKTQVSVQAACDAAFRRVGGVPAYLLTDSEKTVTVEHVAGIPVRNPGAVEFGRHYGLTVATCVPYDPASKGGSESTVKLAKADIVPTDANLLPAYGSFAELEAACGTFCDLVNARPHRVTRRAPAEMLAEERARLHPVPAQPLTTALGVTRRADALSLVTFEGGQYSVPCELAGQVVHVRRHGEHVVIAHAGPDGAAEVARHLATSPGSPRVDDAHYPPAPPGPRGSTAWWTPHTSAARALAGASGPRSGGRPARPGGFRAAQQPSPPRGSHRDGGH